MTTDHKIVSWIHSHMDEFEWYEGTQGGSVSRRNGVSVHVSSTGLILTDGLKSCRINTKEVKKLMDTEDYTAKEVYEKIMEIRTKAIDQIIKRMDNPSEKERIKRALFSQLSEGGF